MPTCLAILDVLLDASADLNPPPASTLVTAHGQLALRLHAVPANTGANLAACHGRRRV